MRKTLLTMALISAAAWPTYVRGADVEYPDREFYSFFMSNAVYADDHEYGEYGFARQTFRNPDACTLIRPFSDMIGVYAAAAADGVYYGVPYRYSSSLSAPTPMPFFSYNLYTDEYEELGAWFDKSFDENFKLSDMTYDSLNDRLLGLGYSSKTGSQIFEIDRSNGHLTLLRDVRITENGDIQPAGVIAADARGRVFVITSGGVLYQVDMTSETRVIKLLETGYSGLIANQSMEFDRTNNKLYWASITYSNPNNDRGAGTELLEITMPVISPDADYMPTDVFTLTDVGELGYGGQALGLYIPYCEGGFKAPGLATDRTFKASADGSSCELSFKAPVKTFGGEELTSLSGYDLLRNGKLIHTSKGITPGQTVTYTDGTVPVSGEYRYDVVCYSNINGNGPKSPIFTYVGFDKPSAVTDLEVRVADDFRDVTLTWTAPDAGYKGGTFNPADTRYDIFRMPDNVKVAEGISETSCTDCLPRLLRYSYRVTASNEVGSTPVVSREFVAGKPLTEFPVDETFDNPTAMLLKWTPTDANADGQTWMFGADYSHSIFGDYEMAANYILSPTSIDPGVGDADDWLISPPIQFGDDSYAMEIEIRSMYPELMSVYTGPRNETAGMQLVKSFNLTEPTYNDAGRSLFNKYYITLPESLRGRTACVALQVSTPLPANQSSFLQVGSISIDTVSELLGAVSVTEGEAARPTFSRDALDISGVFGKAALYNANGMKVLEVTDEHTDLGALPSGMYILTIDGKTYKTVK